MEQAIKAGDRVRIGRGAEMVTVTAVNGVFVYYASRQWYGGRNGYWHTSTAVTLKSNVTEVEAV